LTWGGWALCWVSLPRENAENFRAAGLALADTESGAHGASPIAHDVEAHAGWRGAGCEVGDAAAVIGDGEVKGRAFALGMRGSI